jgi:hypothetical protein
MFNKLVASIVKGFRVSVYGEKTVAYQDTESLADQATSTLKSVGRLEKQMSKSTNKNTLTGMLAVKIQADIVESLDS